MKNNSDKVIKKNKREAFLKKLNQDFKNLRENEDAWASELEERKLLENLLLDGLNSGEATPFTKSDFEAIKKRGLKRLSNKTKE